ncbi:MAG: acetyl-CoA C-acyltransferase [Acidaminococcus sp.]|jgi:acetyl-CoA C-acetyltransferase|nr:acetyl-CoA C-acyltransferase [Acidaminococcus sp.]MCI2100829.1 acetyl-CoA C-acyltransferase [Acidaminococcus sp.]MCI2115192.1 acetyl-CoA C-acyltransferase [Acidaminococcus sp.]MCI2117267.1 acetyl-CoA C-acyltransferase [Acidaminococcus sp.]
MIDQENNKVYVLGGLRSHLGLTHGVFKDIRPEELTAALFRAIFKTWPEAGNPEEIIGGNAVGPGGNVVRLAALSAGVDASVPAFTVDMQCASAAESIAIGWAKIRSSQADLLLCGGVESTSMQPRRIYQPQDPRYSEKGYMVAQFSPDTNSPRAMLEGAERTSQWYDVSREEMDAWAVRSHQKAAQSADVVAPYVVSLFGSSRDEGIRRRMNPALAHRMPALFNQKETLALVNPLRREQGKEPLSEITPKLTAATSCLTHDGAAFVILVSGRLLASWRREGYLKKPWAEITHVCDAAGDPRFSPLGALRVGDALMKRSGFTYADMDTIEYNEAFAVIDALFLRQHPECREAYLPLGGALAYGHPYGASGAVLVLHAIAALKAQHGHYGLCAIAGAGGTGSGMILKNVE